MDVDAPPVPPGTGFCEHEWNSTTAGQLGSAAECPGNFHVCLKCDAPDTSPPAGLVKNVYFQGDGGWALRNAGEIVYKIYEVIGASLKFSPQSSDVADTEDPLDRQRKKFTPKLISRRRCADFSVMPASSRQQYSHFDLSGAQTCDKSPQVLRANATGAVAQG